MSCRRALEIELTDFLAHPRSEAFREFREHYPRCPACTAEVRAWTELHEALLALHPEPELLARYDTLGPEQRADVDGHLSRCASCREELAQLSSFDPARLAAGVGAEAPSKVREERGPGFADWLAGLGRILWHPAFAYALVGLLAFPLLYRSVGPWGDRLAPTASYEVAQELRPRSDLEAGRASSGPRDVPAPAAPERLAPDAQKAPVAQRAPVARARDEAVARKLEAAKERPAFAAPPAPGGQVAGALEPIAESETAAPAVDALEGPRADASRVAFDDSRPEEPATREEEAPSPAGAEFEQLEKGEADSVAPEPTEIEGFVAAGRRKAAASRQALRIAPGAPAAGLMGVAPAPALPRLAPGPPVELPLAAGAEVLAFRVPVLPGTPAGAEAEIRIASPDGRRELRERLRVPGVSDDPARAVVVRVPRSWLEPGVHRVELRTRGVPGEPQRFSFRPTGL